MRSNEPSHLRPRVVPGGRSSGSGPGGSGPRGSGPEGTLRAFLRPTVWTLVASIGLVAITGYVTVRALRAREPAPAPDAGTFRALGEVPLDDGAARGEAPGALHAFPSDAELSQAGRTARAIVEETERGHVDGAWSVARKRFAPCPGEDAERVAWIDVWSRVLKMTGARDDGTVVVEQWFDKEGRLRAARATGAGAERWVATALLDERGGAVHRSASGAAPPLESLRLSARNPSSAFFEAPRCEPKR